MVEERERERGEKQEAESGEWFGTDAMFTDSTMRPTLPMAMLRTGH